MLRTLSEYGYTLALDDVGEGHMDPRRVEGRENLKMIRKMRLPVVLKLDRHLAQPMDPDTCLNVIKRANMKPKRLIFEHFEDEEGWLERLGHVVLLCQMELGIEDFWVSMG